MYSQTELDFISINEYKNASKNLVSLISMLEKKLKQSENPNIIIELENFIIEIVQEHNKKRPLLFQCIKSKRML